MTEYDIEGFKTFLINRGLSFNSVLLYTQSIKKILKEFPDTIEGANEFLSKNKAVRHRSALKCYYEFTQNQEKIPYLSRQKGHQRKKSYALPTEDQIKEIIKNIKHDKMQLIAQIQFDSGRRAAEVVRLNRENISKLPEGDLVFFTIGKNKKPVWFYVSKSTEQKVLQYLTDHQDKYPFMSAYTNVDMQSIQEDIFDRWLKKSTWKYFQSIKEAKELTGVNNFTSHDFRRFFATQMYAFAVERYQKGILKKEPLQFVKDLLGHTLTSTTEQYIKQSPTDLRDAIRLLRG